MNLRLEAPFLPITPFTTGRDASGSIHNALILTIVPQYTEKPEQYNIHSAAGHLGHTAGGRVMVGCVKSRPAVWQLVMRVWAG